MPNKNDPTTNAHSSDGMSLISPTVQTHGMIVDVLISTTTPHPVWTAAVSIHRSSLSRDR